MGGAPGPRVDQWQLSQRIRRTHTLRRGGEGGSEALSPSLRSVPPSLPAYIPLRSEFGRAGPGGQAAGRGDAAAAAWRRVRRRAPGRTPRAAAAAAAERRRSEARARAQGGIDEGFFYGRNFGLGRPDRADRDPVSGGPLLEPEPEYPHTRARLTPEARARQRAFSRRPRDESVAGAAAAAAAPGGSGRTEDPPATPGSDAGAYKLRRLGVPVR